MAPESAPPPAATPTTRTLAAVTAALPGGGEDRPGQQAMAAAVEAALASGRHLLVQAGTGTGKSLAYLVPAALSGKPVVVATATKALQDQLVGKDLPFVADHLPGELSYAVLKGRSNYVCQQRLGELDSPAQLALDGLAERAPEEELRAIRDWAATTPTGDRAELPLEPSAAAWAAVSVGARECPGAQRCPKGDTCFTEVARRVAGEADVVVVNLHLYGLHLESGGAVLPEHDLVVIDEAHQLEDVISSTFGVDLTAGRFAALARTAGSVLEDPSTIDAVESAGLALAATLADHVGRRLRGALDPDIADALVAARLALEGLASGLRAVPTDREDETSNRAVRAQKTTGFLMAEIDSVLATPTDHVAWVEGPEASPSLRVAPVDVGPTLAERLWSDTTAVLTSATVPPAAVTRLGLPSDRVDQLDVGSPFDHEGHALLYCAAHLPDPREPAWEGAAHAELRALDRGGRRPHPGPVHLVPGHGRSGRGAPPPPRRARAHPARPAQARPDRGLRSGRAHLPVRHDGLLAGRRRPRPDPVAGHHRPHPVPPPRRAPHPGPAGGGPGRRLPVGRPGPGRDAPGPGRRAPGAPVRRPRRGRGARPPAGQEVLPLGPGRALPPMRRTKDRAEAEAFLREVTATRPPWTRVQEPRGCRWRSASLAGQPAALGRGSSAMCHHALANPLPSRHTLSTVRSRGGGRTRGGAASPCRP